MLQKFKYISDYRKEKQSKKASKQLRRLKPQGPINIFYKEFAIFTCLLLFLTTVCFSSTYGVKK